MTKLRERMIEDMRVRNFSRHTEEGYLRYVRRFAEHYWKSPEELDSEDVRGFLVHLHMNGAKWSTVSAAGNALRFLYRYTLRRPLDPDLIPRVRKEKTVPHVLSLKQVAKILSAPTSLKHRAILATCYSAGLRVSETVGLRVDDIVSQRNVICVRMGKGKKEGPPLNT